MSVGVHAHFCSLISTSVFKRPFAVFLQGVERGRRSGFSCDSWCRLKFLLKSSESNSCFCFEKFICSSLIKKKKKKIHVVTLTFSTVKRKIFNEREVIICVVRI